MRLNTSYFIQLVVDRTFQPYLFSTLFCTFLLPCVFLCSSEVVMLVMFSICLFEFNLSLSRQFFPLLLMYKTMYYDNIFTYPVAKRSQLTFLHLFAQVTLSPNDCLQFKHQDVWNNFPQLLLFLGHWHCLT